MNVIINGEQHLLSGNISLVEMLKSFDIDTNKVAIERNMEIVPCSEFGATNLCEGDIIEIVQFIGGG